MVSLGSKVKQVSQDRREKEEHLDHRGRLGNKELRYTSKNMKGHIKAIIKVLRVFIWMHTASYWSSYE